MEIWPHQEEQEQFLTPPLEESTDDRVIREGIASALREEREIDDRTARYIASQLHGGQATALYSLASTGAAPEEVQYELAREREQQSAQVQWWIDWLDSYCASREDKGPVLSWATSSAAAERDVQEETARRQLVERLESAAVTTLGQVALVDVGGLSEDTAPDDEDLFPWNDSARWSPELAEYKTHQDYLDELFSRTPTEEVGDAEDMGWFGLLTDHERAGGIIISQNMYGRQRIWEAYSDDELREQWETITNEQACYAVGRSGVGSDSRPGSDQEDGAATFQPQIWVGSLSDYNNGRLHGGWLDATMAPEELYAAASFILRNSHAPDAKEWAILDYSGFGETRIGEYESLKTVSRLARGIAEHGEAFAHWVAYVGECNEEALENFEDHYLGHFESSEAYVEHLLEESDAYSFMEFVPEWLRPYAKIDVEMLARDSEIELHVSDSHNGGVFVYTC